MIGTLCALLLAAVLAGAQFRTSVDMVRVDALVLRDGRPVSGLTAADFVVTDNGEPQAITVQPLARQPIEAVVALDTSDSLRGPGLERLRSAALALVDQLTPDDRATLVTFSHVVTLDPRATRPEMLVPPVRGLIADGATALIDAVTTALAWTSARETPVLLLVFSDGRDTASWTRSEQALALAGRTHAVVDAVVAGDLLPTSTAWIGRGGLIERPTPDERVLTDLAALSGGRVRNGEAGGGLAKAFRDALEQFRARYEITYAATTKAPGWHAIEVQVKGRRGVTVHARRGYQR